MLNRAIPLTSGLRQLLYSRDTLQGAGGSLCTAQVEAGRRARPQRSGDMTSSAPHSAAPPSSRRVRTAALENAYGAPGRGQAPAGHPCAGPRLRTSFILFMLLFRGETPTRWEILEKNRDFTIPLCQRAAVTWEQRHGSAAAGSSHQAQDERLLSCDQEKKHKTNPRAPRNIAHVHALGCPTEQEPGPG